MEPSSVVCDQPARAYKDPRNLDPTTAKTRMIDCSASDFGAFRESAILNGASFSVRGGIEIQNPSVNSIVPGLCTSVFQCYRLLITKMLRVTLC